MKKLSLETRKVVYWTWVDVVEKAKEDYQYAVSRRDKAKQNLEEAEHKVGLKVFVPLVSCLMLLIMAGCNAGRGAGTMIRGIGTDVEQLNQGYMDRHGR